MNVGYDTSFDDSQFIVQEEMEFFRDLEVAKELIRRHGAALVFTHLQNDMPELVEFIHV
jgi:hypothetical protein